MIGAYVAATIVTLVQYLRLRERRLLPLAAMFAFQAQAFSREWFDPWQDVYQALACTAALGLVLLLSLRPPGARSALPPAAAPMEKGGEP